MEPMKASRQCLLCEGAPCTAACPSMDPARIIRALRFNNPGGAAMMLEDVCASCDGAPCQERCPEAVPIRDMMLELKKSRAFGMPFPEDADLSCEICSVPLENPFLLSSSVVASSYEMCARAFEMGWAGAAFKTVSLMDIHEASPRFSAIKGADGALYGFKNIEQLSDHSLEENLSIFTRLKAAYPSKVIVASIMGRNEQEWTYLAQAVTRAGADVIECNFSCPNMEEKGVGVDIGQDVEAVRRFTAAVRAGSKLPILAKMTPNVADMRPMARAAVAAGANGIAAINTIKSITGVDLRTFAAAPAVHGRTAIGGYSGAAVKPIALRFMAELANDPALRGCHISGMGGIDTWHSAVEFMMLGAGSVQITTAVMQYGYRIIDDLLSGLKVYMALLGCRRVSELVGRALGSVVETDELERDTVVYPRFHRERCVGCGRCYLSCLDGGHQALHFDPATRRPVLDPKRCVGCHLCVLVCPKDAITGDTPRRAPIR